MDSKALELINAYRYSIAHSQAKIDEIAPIPDYSRDRTINLEDLFAATYSGDRATTKKVPVVRIGAFDVSPYLIQNLPPIDPSKLES